MCMPWPVACIDNLGVRSLAGAACSCEFVLLELSLSRSAGAFGGGPCLSATWALWLPPAFRELAFRKGPLTALELAHRMQSQLPALSTPRARLEKSLFLPQPGALMLICSLGGPKNGKHVEMNSFISRLLCMCPSSPVWRDSSIHNGMERQGPWGCLGIQFLCVFPKPTQHRLPLVQGPESFRENATSGEVGLHNPQRTSSVTRIPGC